MVVECVLGVLTLNLREKVEFLLTKSIIIEKYEISRFFYLDLIQEMHRCLI